MGTSFATIRGFVRAIVGDTDSNRYMYSNDTLNSHIRLVLMRLNETALAESGESEEFTTELSAANKCRAILRTARSLIAPVSDHFSYKTPVMSVVRQNGMVNLRAHLERELSAVEGGAFAVSSETELEALVNGVTRYNDAYTAAQSAG